MIQAKVWSCNGLMGNHCCKKWGIIAVKRFGHVYAVAKVGAKKGPIFMKGRVHPVTRIEKLEEKITEANSDGNILVLNFKASWCLPCRKIAPILQDLASTYTSMIFVTIDVEEVSELSDEWNVEETPTVMFLKDGKLMDKFIGGDVAELQKKTAAVADLFRQS